ncbi:MAG: SGNH/GDSL hydrolase family protein [Acidimicrobiales bacterium]
MLLESLGLPAEVRNAGVEAQRVNRALCDWDGEVEQWSPDVVILNYGQYECMPGLLPHWLERHATGWHHHSGPVRDRYRIKVLTPIWRKLVRYQMMADQYVHSGPFRASPQRTVTELARFVEQLKTVSSPLVIVMDTWPIGPRWERWFPGMQRRVVVMRKTIERWIESAEDPEIRLFPLSEIVSRHDPEESMPDGVHFSAGLHREIAEELARAILPWAATQPHLRRPGMKLDFVDEVQRGRHASADAAY